MLDYAPDGTTIHPIVRIGRHAAEGIIEASAEQEADLVIFGWGGRAAGGQLGRLLEEDPADLYENAPMGYLSTLPDGRIVKVNRTFSAWTGRPAEALQAEVDA